MVDFQSAYSTYSVILLGDKLVVQQELLTQIHILRYLNG